MLGKYSAENGSTCAAKHYSAVLGIPVNKSTTRRVKERYLEKLKEAILEQRSKQAESQDDSDQDKERKEEPIVISELETKGVFNRTVVGGGGSAFFTWWGHINIARAQSLLRQMGYVKGSVQNFNDTL